jgi:hypothetical protein
MVPEGTSDEPTAMNLSLADGVDGSVRGKPQPQARDDSSTDFGYTRPVPSRHPPELFASLITTIILPHATFDV